MNSRNPTRILFLALSFSAFTGLCGCRGDAEDTGDPGLVLDVAFSPTPPAVGPARLIITLEDTAGSPVEGAEIVVEGNMSHAGMTPVLDTARAEEPGIYGIPDFEFTMAGDWVLELQATLPDGRWVRTAKPTNVVGRIGGRP
jgi:hypothetical protein